MGRTLLLLTGILTVLAAPVLHLDSRAWLNLSLVSMAMLLATAASLLVRWQELPKSMLLVFPTLVFLAFSGLSVDEHAVFAPLSGFFTLCYGYAGLTQRPRYSLWLVAPSSLALVRVYGGLSAPIGVRLIVAVSVWVILAETLASFTARNEDMAVALQRAAYNDALTSLPNRRDLDQQLAVTAHGTSLVICDLDHFKKLNDTYGHSAGDRVLADFGSAARAVLRNDDYCARYGGEEFVLLLPATSPKDTEQVLGRLRRQWALLQPDVTFSAGVAQCQADRDPTATLTAADHALYTAKAAGRNTTRHETQSEPSEAPNRPGPVVRLAGIGTARGLTDHGPRRTRSC